MKEGAETDGGGRGDFVRLERLPKEIARRLDDPPDVPARARPAATVVLMRPAVEGPCDGVEVLLVRRTRSARFVPGAWVFPGGVVEPSDAEPAVVGRVRGPDPDRPLRASGTGEDDPPASAFYVAAVREAFEETGLLLIRDAEGGSAARSTADEPALGRLRRHVLDDAAAFEAVLEHTGGPVDASGLAYIGHWITPALSPQRYDTRFFAAAVRRSGRVEVDGAEVTEAAWLTPDEALEGYRRGRLRMILPTARTLESLRGHASPDDVLRSFAGRRIPRILPRFVRTEEGPGLMVETAG